MTIFKNWLVRNLWSGFTTFEKFFLYGMVALQIVVFYFNPDSALNIIAGVAGVISVVLCAKGRTAF